VLAQPIDELRELACGIHPAALDHGLETALEALAMRAAITTTVSIEPGPACPNQSSSRPTSRRSPTRPSTRTPRSRQIRVSRTPRAAVFEITDDGVGGADLGLGSGLRGLADRVEALGGRFRVSSPSDGGTLLTAELPIPV
jgi:signal transduction histidine kinase